MNSNPKETLKGILSIVLGLALILIPYSLLIGWNGQTVILFWFIFIPALAIYLPTKTSKNRTHFIESLAGLGLFYAFMVFMIYQQYQTDYFLVMIISCLVNLILVGVISKARKQGVQSLS
ncbi:MAG TPA: hypothetical protein PLX35_05840 [Cyclobacteriaceae bacterium]|nr:hypothetical protein [Cyclobacteriaceae bacterium]